MGLSEVVAGQLRKPSGWFGRLVVARLLDRANAPLDELALAKLRASLRDDGRLAVTFNPRSSAERLAYTKHFAAQYGRADVERLVREAGFRDVRSLEGATRPGPCFCTSGISERARGRPLRSPAADPHPAAANRTRPR